jgi:hypothetical protein
VLRDERRGCSPAGLAEYMKRAYGLDGDAVSYLARLRGLPELREPEPTWEIVKEIAVDASSQAIMLRTAFHHWLLIYQNARRAWGRDRDGPLHAAGRLAAREAAARTPTRATRTWRRSSAVLPGSNRLPETAFTASDLRQGLDGHRHAGW